jgi:hypothetical protein
MNLRRAWNQYFVVPRNRRANMLTKYLMGPSHPTRTHGHVVMNMLATLGWILLGLWCLEVFLFLLSYRQSRST